MPQSRNVTVRSTRCAELRLPRAGNAKADQGDFVMGGFRDQLPPLARLQIQSYPRRKIDLFDAVRQTRIEAHPADIPLLAGSFQDVFRRWGKFSDGQQQLLALPNFEKPSLQQLSQRLGRSPSAIAGLLFRGMRTLRRVLVAGI